MSKSKPKPIKLADLPQPCPDHKWVRFQGLEDALPPGVRLPAEKLYHVTLSGSIAEPRAETKYGLTGQVAMAWDVIRLDPQDAPHIFNKEHYFVTRVQGDEVNCELHGPFAEEELDHWMEDIGPEYANCETLMVRGRGK